MFVRSSSFMSKFVADREATRLLSVKLLILQGACILRALLVAWCLFAAMASPAAWAQTGEWGARGGSNSAGAKAQAAENYGKLPISFEANQGQTKPSVKFLARGQGYGLFLTGQEAVLTLHAQQSAKAGHGSAPVGAGNWPAAAATDVVRMQLRGANAAAEPAGIDPLPGTANYFIGNDPSRWRTSIPTYSKVRFSAVYPGVDLVYYGNQSQLEYDFVVAPGADPKAIRLHFAGAHRLRLASGGDLEVIALNGQIAFHKPVVYQMKGGSRQPVEGRFTLLASQDVSFSLGNFDRSEPLVIDPVLVYSTYLGGSGGSYGGDTVQAIAVDSVGDAYLAGYAYSENFPTTGGAIEQTRSNSTYEAYSGTAFVSELNPTGTALVYSTYLGGVSTSTGINDDATALSVDSSGNVYVAGWTHSSSFPVTSGALQTTNHGVSNAFIVKLDSSGDSLLYSTLLGGSGSEGDAAYGLALDSAGSAYVTGSTSSTDFPVTSGSFQTINRADLANAGSNIAFLSKLNTTGTALAFSTYLGGKDSTRYSTGLAVAIDGQGNVYLSGTSSQTDFPVTPGAFQTTGGGSFVTKMNATGTALVYSTFLNNSRANSIAIDSTGNAYVAGSSYTGFPVTQGAYQTAGGGAFVSKLNTTGTALIYSTRLGGSGGENGMGLALDSSANAYVIGSTNSTDFPVTQNAIQTTNKSSNPAGTPTAFVSELNASGSSLLFSTYLGGSGDYHAWGDVANGVAVDASGNIYIAGRTASFDFPVTSNAFQTRLGSVSYDVPNAFVAVINRTVESSTTLSSSANPQTYGQSAAFTATVTGNGTSTVPTGSVIFSVDGVTAATVALSGTGSATYSASTLAVGTHTILANYGGSSSFSASSGTLTETISQAQASAPAFSPAVGSYSTSQTVTLSDATSGATIHYTTDGSTPTASSATYTAPITVSSTETINAIAVASGYVNSVVATATYTVTGTPVILGVSPVSAQAAQSFTISGSGFGAHAAYTGTSAYIGIWDVSEGNWSAGYSGASDNIGLVVSSWTDEAITLGGFINLSTYKETLKNGDELLIKVWNPTTGSGPSVCTVFVGASATVCALLDDSGVISTLAGNGTAGYSGDGGAATSAELWAEDGVGVDSAGNVYIADTYNARIRKVTAGGSISTLAGNGTWGYTGDNGPATSAELNYPIAVAIDQSGNVYIADSGNNVVRKISTAGGISTVAGNGTAGYSGDGGAATSAKLNSPESVAVDSSGNLYIADTNNQRIRKVTAAGGISTIAGTGTAGYAGDGGNATSAELNGPRGIALDAANIIYIADTANYRVRKVTTAGVISTAAGTGVNGFSGDGGQATSAQLASVNAIAVDTSSNIYINDGSNYRVRKVTTAGIISTVAGNGVAGYLGDGGPAIYAETTTAYGIAVDSSGTLYVADTGNSVIRKVSYASAAPAAPVFTPAGGDYAAPASVTITDATTGATLYYSITTSSSSTGWSQYTGPITVSGSETLQAVATASNGQQTASSASYIFPTATPVISPAGGSYTTVQSVSITDATAGASIYYTLDGTTPSVATSPLYTGPLTLTGAVTVTAVGIAPGSSVSAAASASYTLPTPAITLSSASLAFGSQAAGSNSTKTVTVQNSGAGYLTISTIAITGSSLAEFSQSNNCSASLLLSASCTITVTFAPQSATSYAGVLVLTDNVTGSPQRIQLTGAGTGVRIVTTVAGLTRSVYGNGGAATSAELGYPAGAAIDAAGNVYLADGSNNQIRKLNASTGLITAFAGTGQAAYSGDGQLAINAQLSDPQAVVIDASGNLYIADSGNYVIRKVTAATGVISTIAGNGSYGDSGDGGLATAASLGFVAAVAVDSAGNVYLADEDNSVIRKITASTGIISTIAVSSLSLTYPSGLAVDSTGNLYISNTSNSQVDKVAAGTGAVTVYAGNGNYGYSGDGGAATSAELEEPAGLWLDASQNLYIADEGANVIRKVTALTGVISTVAGNGTGGFAGDGGAAISAELSYPVGVVGNTAGALYIVDESNNRLRAVNTSGAISTIAGNGLNSPISSGVSALTQPLLTPYLGAVVKDSSGNLYFTDSGNNIVRKISTSGVITTVAGNGTAGYSGDGKAATSAALSEPLGLALDSAGNLYIADTNNLVIRKVNASTGIITTFAGSQSATSSGDGGLATSAQILTPTGLVFDTAGNLYIAELYVCAVRKVNTAGIISTIAGQAKTCDYTQVGSKKGDGGPATSATLSYLTNALAIDAQSNLYLGGASSVREFNASTGIISTVAGGNGNGLTDSGDGGTAVSASLNQINGLAFDPSGNLYISDGTVRVVNSSGIISTAGTGGGTGYSGDGGLVSSAKAKTSGVAVDGTGNIYFVDTAGNRLRQISSASAAQVAAATPAFTPAAGSISTLQTVTIADTTAGAQIFYTLDGSTPSPSTSNLYTGPLALLGTVKLSAVAIAPGYSTSAVVAGSYKVTTPQAATPTFSVAAGTYTSAQRVTIADATAGSSIYYTTTGKTPTPSSTKYTGAITVSSTETIEAIAVATGYSQSAVAKATYTITPPAATPTFSVAAGTYSSAQRVTIADATAGSSIYYTTTGKTPTTSSTKYSSAITVSSTETIEAIAVATGYAQSAVAKATYTITPPTAAPTFAPVAGTYGEAQLVTLSSTTPKATIYYTTNGVTPTTSSTVYTGPVAVTSTETLTAIAVASGYTNSPSAVAAYTLVASPQVLTGLASFITTTTATLNATANDANVAGQAWFVWSKNKTALTSTTTKVVEPASAASQSATAPLTGLVTKTTYYFQPVVSTIAGVTYGAIQSFTTN